MVPAAAFVGVTLVWLIPLVISLNGDIGKLGVLVGAVNGSSLFAPPEPTILIPLAGNPWRMWVLRRDSHPYLRWYLLAGLALFATQFPRMDTLHLVWSAPLLLVIGAIALVAACPGAVAIVGARTQPGPTRADLDGPPGVPFRAARARRRRPGPDPDRGRPPWPDR